MENITIKGARVHNLKNLDLVLPRDKMVVITGLSGSGKSSLAFDTIYAEGERRYVESLSTYARQFLGKLDKPDVDKIEGLSPAIAIDQKTTSKNPRSTVGTITEIYDHLRLLYGAIGIPHCPACGKPVIKQTLDEIVNLIFKKNSGERFMILAPLIKGRKGEYQKLFESLKKRGFLRIRVDNSFYSLEEAIPLDKNIKHNIELVVDRLVIDQENKKVITDSIETALHEGSGIIQIYFPDTDHTDIYSQNYACPDCDISLPDIDAKYFSFNNPYGACQECSGLGVKFKLDPNFVVKDENHSIAEGALHFGILRMIGVRWKVIAALAEKFKIDLYRPFRELSEKERQILLFGSDEQINFNYQQDDKQHSYQLDGFEGIIPKVERFYERSENDPTTKKYLSKYLITQQCPVCHGARLNDIALSVLVNNRNINQLTSLSIKDLSEFFKKLKLSAQEQKIAKIVLKEIDKRLNFLIDVGLDYLTLDRKAGTLSGGEAQRIRLATQIGAGLVGVLYVLDEPSIGLHQKDNDKLLNTLKNLRDLGNTLIIVEHDEATMKHSDQIVDIGPGAGKHGGKVIFQGTYEEILKSNTQTGKYLSGREQISAPKEYRKYSARTISISGASEHNLKNIKVDIPLGLFNVITGVSGSGKSTLVHDILYKAAARTIYKSKDEPGQYQSIEGLEEVDKVIIIDQSPIGRTPRSNPATYTGLFGPIRDLFAQTNEAKLKGYKPGRFSFNVKGGRCEACEGDGAIKIEMNFLPDVYVTCDICKGARYNKETLEVRYKDNNISDVLNMTVEEARGFFENIPAIKNKLNLLYEVGLDYIHLGQPATTLSGGEAQRIKLASELSKKATGKTLYILDEPTTGLHFADIKKLLFVLNRLVDSGNTIVIIEHNLDIIKNADHIIDLGPDGGEKGGELIFSGRPSEIINEKRSYTGKYLKDVLG